MRKCVIFLILVAVTVFVFAACNSNSDSQTNETIQDPQTASGNQNPNESTMQTEHETNLFQHPELGFSFEYPSTWEGRFTVENLPGGDEDGAARGIQLFHVATQQDLESEFVGWLFSIVRTSAATWTNDIPAPFGEVLAETEEYVFFINLPSDVQWDFDNPQGASAIEYQEMEGQLDVVIDSFRLME